MKCSTKIINKELFAKLTKLHVWCFWNVPHTYSDCSNFHLYECIMMYTVYTKRFAKETLLAFEDFITIREYFYHYNNEPIWLDVTGYDGIKKICIDIELPRNYCPKTEILTVSTFLGFIDFIDERDLFLNEFPNEKLQ